MVFLLSQEWWRKNESITHSVRYLHCQHWYNAKLEKTRVKNLTFEQTSSSCCSYTLNDRASASAMWQTDGFSIFLWCNPHQVTCKIEVTRCNRNHRRSLWTNPKGLFMEIESECQPYDIIYIAVIFDVAFMIAVAHRTFRIFHSLSFGVNKL